MEEEFETAWSSEEAYTALQLATKSTVEKYQVTGYFIGKVIDVYDGDTCRVAFVLPEPNGKGTRVKYFQVRMLGYDSPEMQRVNDIDHRPYGEEVRDILRTLILDKIVALYIPVPDKVDPYGRILAHLYAVVRGARLQVIRQSPPPHTRCKRWLCCCCCWSRAGRQSPELRVITVRANDEKSSAQGLITTKVRGRPIYVPVTVDIPHGFQPNSVSLETLMHVNQWMIDNARVKEYDGSRARPKWTAEEIEKGI